MQRSRRPLVENPNFSHAWVWFLAMIFNVTLWVYWVFNESCLRFSCIPTCGVRICMPIAALRAVGLKWLMLCWWIVLDVCFFGLWVVCCCLG
ncbi:hypothetical protein BDV36DRAFT_242425 [Aspergillus pseudocaelatus]|uniref:Transmembrane protein n=1 Tax=Aspergillus pseudocaelatus TaxID=1825620 RepID=A0ABQ6X3P4_9EURO|nr:hypothetical protein BDV36DRAFT_242425 [Aspergillus pseudocaelatus]